MSFFKKSPGRSRGIGVHGYLGMVSTCRTVASCVSVGGANRSSAAEAQVDAEEDLVEVALDVQGERRADERGDEEVSVAEEDVVVLDPHRPCTPRALREHPLEPAADVASARITITVAVTGDEHDVVDRIEHVEPTTLHGAPSARGVDQEGL